MCIQAFKLLALMQNTSLASIIYETKTSDIWGGYWKLAVQKSGSFSI